MPDNIRREGQPTYLTGDATGPVGVGPKIIAHVCNNIGAWGAGFTAALSRRWPGVEKSYLGIPRKFLQLGTCYPVIVERDIMLLHMVAQRGVRSRANPAPLDLDALDLCLRFLGIVAEPLRRPVHMPRIGCGLAGGKWTDIEPLIRQHVTSRGVDVTVYDLP